MANFYKIVITICFFLICSFQNSLAQEINLREEISEGIIRIAGPGQLADTLSLWGDVRVAGRYLVPRSTNLTELISMANGPAGLTAGDAFSTVELEVYVSRYNERLDKFQMETFTVQLNEPFPPAMKNYPLQNGDVVTVKADQDASFRDYFTIIAPIVSLGLTTFLVLDRL